MSARGDRVRAAGRHVHTAGHRVIDPVRDEIATDALLGRAQRLRARLWLIAQAAVGATLAWWIAADLLGHTVPFFAPITAMVCLGLTYDHRVRRIIELTIGVAIGIFVADLFVHQFGSGLWQLLVVVVVAMSLAVLAGSGQLLMTQAGVQAVIVSTVVAGDGEAFNRWLDALVGGGVALAIAMLAPMRSTTRRPRERGIDLVGHLAEVLTDTAQALRNQDLGRAERALARARELSAELESLRTSTDEALAAARLAPFLARADRREVAQMREVITPLDLAIRNVRVLVRRAEAALAGDERVPPTYIDLVAGLAQAAATVQEHLREHHPLTEAQEELVTLARQSTWAQPRATLSAEVLRAQVRSTVVDLLVLSGMPRVQARRRVPPTREEMDPEE